MNQTTNKSYIVCHLNDGTVIDFDKRCNEIGELSYNNDYCMVAFKLVNIKRAHINLAAIPVSQIKRIEFVHSEAFINEFLNEKFLTNERR